MFWICDDDRKTEQRWKNKLEDVPTLQETFDISLATAPELVTRANALEKRRKDARDRNDLPDSYSENEVVSIFDDADILIIRPYTE